MKEERVLGIDLGGTHLRLGLVDPQHQLSEFTILRTREVLIGPDSVASLVAAVRAYCSSRLGNSMPAAVSIGFPSTVDRSRRVVISTPNIPGLDNMPIAEIMERELGIPVFVNRDVNFLMLHDLMENQVDEKPVVLGFYIGTGFGNVVCTDGRMLLGKHGMAAELGHIPLYRVVEKCTCGNEGCIETVASGVHLERLHREHFADVPLNQLFIRHAEHPVLRQFIDDLSIPISTEVNIFDPDCIILGGGILQMSGFPAKYLEERIYHHVRKPYPGLDFDILYASPNQENGVIGAGIYAYKRMNDPSYI